MPGVMLESNPTACADTTPYACAALPDDLVLQILQCKSKLALMSLGKAWHAAMAHPEVHVCLAHLPGRDKQDSGSGKLSLGPAAKLQAAILAPCRMLDVTFDMESDLSWLPEHLEALTLHHDATSNTSQR